MEICCKAMKCTFKDSTFWVLLQNSGLLHKQYMSVDKLQASVKYTHHHRNWSTNPNIFVCSVNHCSELRVCVFKSAAVDDRWDDVWHSVVHRLCRVKGFPCEEETTNRLSKDLMRSWFNLNFIKGITPWDDPSYFWGDLNNTQNNSKYNTFE